jgi:hypothetical protein
MIHGDHWESVIDINDVSSLAKLYKKILQEGKPSSTKKYSFRDGEKTFKYFTYPNTNLKFLSVGVLNTQQGAYEIINSIPFCAHGTDVFLKINEVNVDRNTYEAIIESSTVDGVLINFYDPLFFMNMDIYMKDTFRIFRLSGLAYSLFKTKSEKITLLEKSSAKIESDNQNESFQYRIELDADKGRAFYNLSQLKNLPYDYDLDTCFVQSFIEEVSEFILEGETIYQIHLSIGSYEKPIKLIIYAAKRIIEPGYIPQIGDNVYSYVWMQAYSTH